MERTINCYNQCYTYNDVIDFLRVHIFATDINEILITWKSVNIWRKWIESLT